MQEISGTCAPIACRPRCLRLVGVDVGAVGAVIAGGSCCWSTSFPICHFRHLRSQPNPPPHPLPRPPPHPLPRPPPPPDRQYIPHHDIHRHLYLRQSTTGGTVSIASQTRGASFLCCNKKRRSSSFGHPVRPKYRARGHHPAPLSHVLGVPPSLCALPSCAPAQTRTT